MPWPLRKAIRVKGRLDDAQVDRLLDQLDFDGLCHERLLTCRRKNKRYPYRVRGISIGLNQNGEDATLVVSGRNLSTTGLAFLHLGPIPPGTACRIRLISLEGAEQVVLGTVAHCRALREKGNLHEVGTKFDQPIDPQRFVVVD